MLAMTQPPTRRHARCALILGFAAVAIRAATLGAVAFAGGTDGKRAFDLGDASTLLAVANPVGSVLALAGVGYSAIAAHRREWSATLVSAWILSVAAALFIPEMFIFAAL